MSTEPDQELPPAESNAEESETGVHGVLEIAANGRARCRACGTGLGKGEWRLGERAKNPFGEGDTTYWFHLPCGALRRPEVFLAALDEREHGAENSMFDAWLVTVRFGGEHHRAGRVAAVGVAPSGRARCRHCRELIEKGDVRIELTIFKEGRFDPMGYLHPKCLTGYVGATVPVERFDGLIGGLSEEHRQVIIEACGGPSQR